MSLGPEWHRVTGTSVTQLREPAAYSQAAVDLMQWTLGQIEQAHHASDAGAAELRRVLAEARSSRGGGEPFSS